MCVRQRERVIKCVCLTELMECVHGCMGACVFVCVCVCYLHCEGTQCSERSENQ